MEKVQRGSVDLTIEGGTAFITISTPGRLNAISLDMWNRIPGLVRQVDRDPALRVMVLRGAGKQAFSAGADISEFPTTRFTVEQGRRYDQAILDAERSIIDARIPSIAAITGWCVGGGFELAMACDIRISHDDSKFGLTPAKVGIIYGKQSVDRLSKVLGPGLAKYLLFTGNIINTAEATRFGIVHEVHPVDSFEDGLQNLTQKIAQGNPLTQLAADRMINTPKTAAGESEQTWRNFYDASYVDAGYQRVVDGFINDRPENFSSATRAHALDTERKEK